MLCLPPSTFVEEYMIFFHISIFWKNTWCSSTFLFHESILILPRLMFVKIYFKSSTFHIYFLLKYMLSSTFNIYGRLCLVFLLLHLSKNTWCSSTFLFHESILILPRLMFVKSYVKSSTFHICGRIHDIFPHLYFVT